MKSGRGRFYGVGITSRKPGYYLSYALRRGEAVRGVVAVKVNIEDAERAWRQLPGHVLLIDERGVVILSTRDDWKYRPLAPLDASSGRKAAPRPYDEAEQPLRWASADARSGRSDRPTGSSAGDRASIAACAVAAAGSMIWRRSRHGTPRSLQVWRWRCAAGGGDAVARQRAVRHKLASQAALQAAHDSLNRWSSRAQPSCVPPRPTWFMRARWPHSARCRPAWCTS
jgi:two-component system C4-dicarboxylate transport sensor histidine kinase DctB